MYTISLKLASYMFLIGQFLHKFIVTAIYKISFGQKNSDALSDFIVNCIFSTFLWKSKIETNKKVKFSLWPSIQFRSFYKKTKSRKSLQFQDWNRAETKDSRILLSLAETFYWINPLILYYVIQYIIRIFNNSLLNCFLIIKILFP